MWSIDKIILNRVFDSTATTIKQLAEKESVRCDVSEVPTLELRITHRFRNLEIHIDQENPQLKGFLHNLVDKFFD